MSLYPNIAKYLARSYCCFQVTRTIRHDSGQTIMKTIFLKEPSSLGYLGFNGPGFSFTDNYVAMWKIKHPNQ